MTKAEFEIRTARYPLKRPYRLSFGDVADFETFLVRVVAPWGTGYGEITPLPGYSAETVESVREGIRIIRQFASDGEVFRMRLRHLRDSLPMTASGFLSALDVAEMGQEQIFSFQPQQEIAVAALCEGKTAEDASKSAKRLVAEGFDTLKVKVGGQHIREDIARIEAISERISGRARMRIDANQGLSEKDLTELLQAVSTLPVELVEQPFATDSDALMRRYALETDVPLMLDESIWNEDDIRRASDLGVSYVKLKLCKHPGLKATNELISLARALGLGVVFGNGVQGPVGNRIEIHSYAQAGLATAIEANGFAKLAHNDAPTGLAMHRGRIVVDGPTDVAGWFGAASTLEEFEADIGTDR